MKRDITVLLASIALLAWGTGCRVHVDKDASGQENHVQVDTPFGGVHVNTNQLTATDLGLPVYPGSSLVNDDKHKSADVHMGFGEWQMRVRAVSYSTPDSQEKVLAFYKKALGRYGDVITCQASTPVGKPAATAEGLTCADDGKNSNVQIDSDHNGNGYDLSSGLQLKAGSKHHQHIVGFEDAKTGMTHFALVGLDLPEIGNSGDEKSD